MAKTIVNNNIKLKTTGGILNSTTDGLLVNQLSKFGGTGVDGVLNITSGTTTIDAINQNVVIKNYSSINIDAGTTLTISNPATTGTILILKSQGDVRIAGTINMQGMGAAGANTGFTILDDLTHLGAVGSTSAPTPGGAALTMQKYYANKTLYFGNKSLNGAVGTGGSAGAGSGGGSGAAGIAGRGGGGLVIECAGALDFVTGGVINVSGQNGGNATATSNYTAGAGSGGSVGFAFVLYNTLTANNGTKTSSGGNGGAGAFQGSPSPGNEQQGACGAGSYGVGGVGGGNFNATPGQDGADGSGAGGGGGSNTSAYRVGGTGGAYANAILIVKNEYF